MKTEEYALQEVELKGFQLVKSQYFARQVDPSMTLWETAVSFGTASFDALDKCEFINMYVDYDKRKILIKPTTSKAREAIKWIKIWKSLYRQGLNVPALPDQCLKRGSTTTDTDTGHTENLFKATKKSCFFLTFPMQRYGKGQKW